MYENKLEKHNQRTDSSIISIKEARKLLGKEISDKLSDEEIIEAISSLHELAEKLLDMLV